MKYILLLLSIIFLMESNAYAYLDPATGSLILQYLIAGIAAVASTATFFWQKLSDFFVKKIMKKKLQEDSSDKNLKKNSNK